MCMIGCLGNRHMARPSLAGHKHGFRASPCMQKKAQFDLRYICTYSHAHAGIQSEVKGRSTHGQRPVAKKHATNHADLGAGTDRRQRGDPTSTGTGEDIDGGAGEPETESARGVAGGRRNEHLSDRRAGLGEEKSSKQWLWHTGHCTVQCLEHIR